MYKSESCHGNWRKLHFPAVILMSIAILLAPQSSIADSGVCLSLKAIEAEMNPTAPTSLDSISELIQVRTNCRIKSVTHVHRLLVNSVTLSSSWRQKKERRQIQFNCNRLRVALTKGWIVRDEIYALDNRLALILLTTSLSCR